MKLLVIGFGNMGSAIVRALLAREAALFDSIAVFDYSEEKIAMAKTLGLEILKSLDEIKGDEVILLAVKPQDMETLLGGLKEKLQEKALLVSIAAGVTLERLQQYSGHAAVVRVMPNTPALVGHGASGWIASEAVTKEQHDLVLNMLNSFGIAAEMETEDQIDMVTALSGSGPGYVFYFMEAFVEGAVKLGLHGEDAFNLVMQTVAGSAELAKSAESLDDLRQLRENVTSKGGTTERGLGVLSEAALRTIVEKAIRAAYNRAKEL